MKAPPMMLGSHRTWCLAVALSLPCGGCVKKYAEIRVHDAGKVGVGMPTARGPVPWLLPDGVERSVPLRRDGPEQIPLAIRHGRQIAPVDQIAGDLGSARS